MSTCGDLQVYTRLAALNERLTRLENEREEQPVHGPKTARDVETRRVLHALGLSEGDPRSCVTQGEHWVSAAFRSVVTGVQISWAAEALGHQKFSVDAGDSKIVFTWHTDTEWEQNR